MNVSKRVVGWLGAITLAGLAARPAGAQPLPPPNRVPQIWTIIIGIDNYIDPGIADSKTAADSALRVRLWFRAAGWEDDHQLLLRDFGSTDPGMRDAPAGNILPTRNNLNWAIDEWLLPRAKAGDLVVIYYAGQTGTVAAAAAPRVEPRVEHFLLPINATRSDPSGTGWSLDRAVDRCALRRVQVVCWLATATGERRVPAPLNKARIPTPVATGEQWLRRLTRWPGVSAWLSTDRSRAAGDVLDPAGPFTSALLAGLGHPDAMKNLSSCLKQLQQDSRLGLQGFLAMGRVPPRVNLWRGVFARNDPPPRPEVVLQAGHADKVTGLAVTADNQFLITSSQDSTVRTWSLSDGALLHVWSGQTSGATAVGLSGDDRWVVMGGGRGTVRVGDLNNFTLAPAPRPPHTVRVDVVRVLPDGRHLVSVDRDGSAVLCDLAVSPLDPKPWPARELRCLEVSGGGMSDDGTVAARFHDGTVRLFDAHGGGGAVITPQPGRPTALAVSPDGRILALAFPGGRLTLREIRGGKEIDLPSVPSAVRRLAISATGWVAVSHEQGLRLVPPAATRGAERGGKSADLSDRPAGDMAFSPDGRYLVACTEGLGELRTWSLDGANTPQLIHEVPNARAAVVGFTLDGRAVVSGGLKGSVAFHLLEPSAGGEHSWKVAANRGKLQRLDSSPSRRYLVVLTDDLQVQVWDLKDRTCRGLPGRWTSAVFLDDDTLILTAAADAPAHAARLVLARRNADRNRFDLAPDFFARSQESFRLPDTLSFEGTVLSPDRTRVAARANPTQSELVCIWDTKSGRLTHRISRLDDAALSLGFSSDGRRLLTACDSSEARLWLLEGRKEGEIAESEVTFRDTQTGPARITCAAIRPSHDQLATGHSDGQVHLWSWKEGKAKLEVAGLVQGSFAGVVKALTFTADGKRLAAAGDGTSIWLGTLDDPPAEVDDLNGLRPHHYEQINAMLAWRDPPMLITASDDTTVRFWDLKRKALWGTFSAMGMTSEPGAPANLPVTDLDWVFYTPDGFFDASAEGQKRIRFRHRDEANLPEQFENTHYRFRLGETLLGGEPPRLARELDEPPPISIVPPTRDDPTVPDTELTVTLGTAGWTDVGLYHNDRPIATGLEHAKKPLPEQFTVKTRLIEGSNRFYVMASREGSYSSISEPLTVEYQGPMEPSRVHVIALGVGAYEKRELKYSGRDASRISEVLHERGLDTAGGRGLRIFLSDDDVTPEKLEDAFDQVAAKVEDRPQDKVVVFLAGHTGVFETNRFCLLLPTYPFPPDAPAVALARDAAPQLAPGVAFDPSFVLPYSIVALNLMRLKALDRLVIVDACQAESILQDPQVVAVQKWMEQGARKARTSYLMAARRGEPALEVDPLRHGLFTYTLLHGLGAIRAADEPEEIAKLNLPDNADFNDDGVLSIGELDAYVKANLKPIARVFPEIVVKREAELPVGTPRIPAEKLEQHPILQSFGVSFPLVRLANRNPASKP